MFSALLTFLETKGKLDDIIRRQKCVKGFKTDNILKIIKILTTEHFQTNVFNQTDRKCNTLHDSGGYILQNKTGSDAL